MLSAISDALVTFANASPDASSLAADLLGRKGLEGPKLCNARQIARLDGVFGIYRNLVGKVLFNEFTDYEFEKMFSDLPCNAAFESFIKSHPLPTGDELDTLYSVCGNYLSDVDKMLSTDCLDHQWKDMSFREHASSFIDGLGLRGAYDIFTEDLEAGKKILVSRCEHDEIHSINSPIVYDTIVRCAWQNDISSTEYIDCLHHNWPDSGYVLVGEGRALSCASCSFCLAWGC